MVRVHTIVMMSFILHITVKMRYHTTQPDMDIHIYGEEYKCNHPIYSTGTLVQIVRHPEGVVLIQQRYDSKTKHTWWGPVDNWVVNDIYLHKHFREWFRENAKAKDQNGLYPTYTVRQVMWALRMKPLPKQVWETYFDHKI